MITQIVSDQSCAGNKNTPNPCHFILSKKKIKRWLIPFILSVSIWAGGREKHAMSTNGDICFRSIRNFSPCHVYEWVLLFFQSFLLIIHRW
jgi:hypothetical protein